MERTRVGFVNEVLVEQTDGRKLYAERVTDEGNALLVKLLQVYTNAQCSLVDSHQMIIREEPFARGVYQFLLADGKKLPLAYVFDGLYLFRGESYFVAVFHTSAENGVASHEEPEGCERNEK